MSQELTVLLAAEVSQSLACPTGAPWKMEEDLLSSSLEVGNAQVIIYGITRSCYKYRKPKKTQWVYICICYIQYAEMEVLTDKLHFPSCMSQH